MRRTIMIGAVVLGGVCLTRMSTQALPQQGPCLNDTLKTERGDCDGNTEVRFEEGHFGPLAPGWNSETDSGIDPIRIPKVQLGPGEQLLAVEVIGRLVLTGTWSVENLGTSPCTHEVVYEPSGHTWLGSGGAVPLHYLGSEFRENEELGYFDGTIDYDGASGHVFETPPGGVEDTGLTGFSPGPVFDYFIADTPGDELEVQHSVSADWYDTGCYETVELLDFQVELFIERRYIVCLSGCNSDPPVVVTMEVPFSVLDGGPADGDGVPNGELELSGLIIGGWGKIEIASCGTDTDSIRIRGRVLADGTGWQGVGGEILLDAHWGGIYLPGFNKCLATGDLADGTITLFYRTVIGPNVEPIVEPDPILIPDGPDHGDCSCIVAAEGN